MERTPIVAIKNADRRQRDYSLPMYHGVRPVHPHDTLDLTGRIIAIKQETTRTTEWVTRCQARCDRHGVTSTTNFYLLFPLSLFHMYP